MKLNSTIAFFLICSYVYAKETVPLQEITVTAQKYEEKQIDVPISLNVFNEFEIEDKNIESFTDLATFSSNFSIFDAGGTGILSPSIRGISSDTLIESGSVGIYVDGVPYVSTMGNEISIQNIQRIEILKGPQSTIYGKNSYSGAVNIITKSPEKSTYGHFGISLAEDKKKEYIFSLNTPIIENKLLLNATVKHYEKDGFIKNTTLNKYDNFKENKYFKTYFKYLANDKLNISLISSLFKTDDGAPTMNLTSAPNLRVLSSNKQGFKNLDTQTHALNIDYEFSDFKFSSLTTMKDSKERTFYDGDVSSLALFYYDINIKNKEYTQEFRLAKKTQNNHYMIGFYFDSFDNYRDNKANDFTFQKFGIKSKTISIFTNNDFSLNKDFTLSLGLRIDKDEIEMQDEMIDYSDSNKYTNVSPKVSLKYKPYDNFMSYITVSKGYKSGNYYGFAPTPQERWYNKESLVNYELGFKYNYQNKLNLALSLFHIDIKDKQVNTNIAYNVGKIDNAASSQSQGLELDINYEILKGLNVYSSLGFNKTKFKNFKDLNGDYSGNRNPFSPKYTFALGAKYRNADGIFANLNLKGQSDIYADKENKNKTDKYHMINAKIGYEEDNYEVYLYANNITNRKNDVYWGSFSFPSAPREVGVKFKYRF